MNELIDDLISSKSQVYSKIEFSSELSRSRFERDLVVYSEINMMKLVKSVISELSLNNIKITQYVLLPSRGQESMIRHVWMHLISNAIKYSKSRAYSRIEVGCYEKYNHIVYYVKDNGIGFDMKYYNKLFVIFQRLHPQGNFEGAGIGLAVVKKMIYHHHGHVWAESQLDNGACFYFSLPITSVRLD